MIDIGDVVRRLAADLEAIRALMHVVSDEQGQWKPDADTWSLQEVLTHFYNEERLDFRKHLNEMLADPPQPWSLISTAERVSTDSWRQALDAFTGEREASIAWLRSLDEMGAVDWNITSAAPWGTISAGDVLVSWVEHDFLHMRQIIELLHAWNVHQADPYSVDYAGGW